MMAARRLPRDKCVSVCRLTSFAAEADERLAA